MKMKAGTGGGASGDKTGRVVHDEGWSRAAEGRGLGEV